MVINPFSSCIKKSDSSNSKLIQQWLIGPYYAFAGLICWKLLQVLTSDSKWVVQILTGKVHIHAMLMNTGIICWLAALGSSLLLWPSFSQLFFSSSFTPFPQRRLFKLEGELKLTRLLSSELCSTQQFPFSMLTYTLVQSDSEKKSQLLAL